MNILDFYQKKLTHKKITMVTCYDYTSATILAETTVDSLLVGDSLAMTMHGHKDTLSATLPMMSLHTAAVAKGASNKLIVSDLPFLSYRKSLTHSVNAVQTLLQAGAHAIKLEGAFGNIKLIRHLVESGVPVMGHLGLTPQFINLFGGFKAQGKTIESAERIKQEAFMLQEAGCFSLVLECIPASLAIEVTKSLSIPTIGIGAGPDTDGQVLVLQDVLGMNMGFKPKFVKSFLSGHELITQSINSFVDAIHSGEFPHAEHCYGNEAMANIKKVLGQ